jgi:putative transposase
VAVADRRVAVTKGVEAVLSGRRACWLVGMERKTYRYRSRRPRREDLRCRLRALAEERVRWGYRRLHILLDREGVIANHRMVYRIYREEGLAVRRRKRKRVSVPRRPMVAPNRVNERWSMDYMSDVLRGGRRIRIFNVVDDRTREILASEVDTSLPARRVIQVLEEVALERGYPERIVCDNGPEFRSQVLDTWAYEHGVAIDFIQPGKPMQNPYVESLNGKMRDECLNIHWFSDLTEARRRIAEWKEDHTHVRPHSSLGDRTPAEAREAELRGTPDKGKLAIVALAVS